MCCTRARAHRPTGCLEREGTNNISDDNDDAKDLCPQEGPEGFKERVENFKFY